MKNYVLLFISALIVMACSSSRSTSETTQWEYNTADNGGFVVVSSEKLGETGEIPVNNERKIIYNALFHIRVFNTDSANAQLSRIAEKYEGYVLSSGSYETVIRVKSKHLNTVLSSVTSIGDVTYKNVYSNDVTDDYDDYTIRLENATKTRDRYLELLEKAVNVEEILLIEKELERLNEEIELLKGRLTRFDHLIEYSTITVQLKERKKLGLLGAIFVGLYKGTRWLFVRG